MKIYREDDPMAKMPKIEVHALEDETVGPLALDPADLQSFRLMTARRLRDSLAGTPLTDEQLAAFASFVSLWPLEPLRSVMGLLLACDVGDTLEEIEEIVAAVNEFVAKNPEKFSPLKKV